MPKREGLRHFRGTPYADDTPPQPSTRDVLHSLTECSDRRAPGETESAICVQRLDDSLNSAIHTRYRSLLRSSSMHEPRGPPLEVVQFFYSNNQSRQTSVIKKKDDKGARGEEVDPDFDVHPRSRNVRLRTWQTPVARPNDNRDGRDTVHRVRQRNANGNDPSAGSPTETLLRLLLPLNDQV